MPWARILPRAANAVTAASVRPTPEPPTIRSRSHAPSSSAAAIDPASRPAAVKETVSAPVACALSAIRSAVTLPPGTLTMRSRGRRTFNRSNPAARAIRRSRGSTRRPASTTRLPAAISPPARRTPCPGIASASTCGIGPDTSTESESSTQSQAVRHRLAGLDPDRRRRQRQRRIGGCADEIARAECVAVHRGDVARRMGREAAASRRRCNAAPPQASVLPARPVPRPAAGRRAPYRAASARSAGAGARSWLGYALNRAGNKQNRVPLAGQPLHSATLTPAQNSCK